MAYPERVEGEVGVYERWDVGRHTNALVAMGRDPEVMRHLGGPQEWGASADLSKALADRWATDGFGLWACLDDDGRCVGFSGACRAGSVWGPLFPGEVEVGWRLDRRAWGRGLATEGARLAIAAARDELGLGHVVAFVAEANARSQAVAGRLGMTRRQGAVDPVLGVPVDVYELALARAAAA